MRFFQHISDRVESVLLKADWSTADGLLNVMWMERIAVVPFVYIHYSFSVLT